MLAAAQLEVRGKFEVGGCSARLDRESHARPPPPALHLCYNLWLRLQSARAVADSAQVEQLQAEGREAAEFIRNMLVQAPMNERGNYGERGSSSAGWAQGGGRLFVARKDYARAPPMRPFSRRCT